MRGKWFYNTENIETIICRDAGPCQMRLLSPTRRARNRRQLDISAVSTHLPGLVRGLRTLLLPYVIGQVEKAVKRDMKQRRAMSRKYRWEIAWRQQYKCLECSQLLHFQAFDIDHVKELRDGGLDEKSNLAALCCNCHAKKTRSFR